MKVFCVNCQKKTEQTERKFPNGEIDFVCKCGKFVRFSKVGNNKLEKLIEKHEKANKI